MRSTTPSTPARRSGSSSPGGIGYETVARRRLEAAADLAAERRPDRDVLDVGVGRGQAPGRRRRLDERGVQARVGVDHARQRLQVRLGELVELAPALDLGDDLVLVADGLQHARIGGEAGLAAALLRQAELDEEDLAELLGRADDELLAGEAVDVVL